ncbi:MAG TPA: TAXI family TRAP transporter solute-binding subunit [Stellaceae bacterium]|nr:TAXI family TRAP transporter solute-binding subunit [Stellaceae bacterium]
MADPAGPNPNETRSRIILEIAGQMVAARGARRQVKVLLRDQGASDWPLCLFGSSTNEGIAAVAKGEAALALINPAGPLTVAYRGAPPYQGPQPVRTIAVIPSLDQYVFAVRPETGLATVEDIAARRYPLRVSLRGYRDHCLHFMLDHILAAAGFSLDALRSWGGEARYEGALPWIDSAKFNALLSGEVDAIFDEAADVWVDQAAAAGIRILPLGAATLGKLEAMGYRRGIIEKRLYPHLPHDVASVDFSGWPIFVHADLPDALVTQICAAIEARKDHIPWQEPGPLPTARMCRDAIDTPLDVPLHQAAEAFWRGCGYIR